eukprot:568601-Amphidinium_carterae.1
MREGSGATEDRETVDEYSEETREMHNEYRMIDDNENKYQTLRMYSECKDGTVGMMKMNLKLPTPTHYDGKTPQFNEWSREVKAHLTVHNIFIEDLMEDSTKSQVPMVVATMQRDAVADDLQRFNQRYPHAVNYGDDHNEDYMDRWEVMEEKKADIVHFSQTLNHVLFHATK